MIDGYAHYIEPAVWQIAAWDRQAPDDMHFISRYVHDSKVDFIATVEPFARRQAQAAANAVECGYRATTTGKNAAAAAGRVANDAREGAR